TFLAGASGVYLLYALDGWSRYLELRFWWIHLMTLVWLLFSLVLYVLEPLWLHNWFSRQAAHDAERIFSLIHRMHALLLSLSLLAFAGAVAGSHGHYLF
ncbi:MAG: hypothetical protein KDK39_14400, partial [Leptospiraceae bacterium]|nr:hypothetical protein [Leptospiraceae bacterium]